jgi:UDP-2,3-diacylglucosamine pyrophosphatase LpxH
MIYCISDLHFGNRGPRDNFYARGTERLYRFLNYVAAKEGELFILGDLFEWFQSNLSESVVAYRHVLDRLNDFIPQYVFGNHDAAFVKFIGTDWMPNIPVIQSGGGPFTRVIGNKLFVFAHGHEFDSACRSLDPGLGEVTAVMSAMLEDKNSGPNNSSGAVEDSFIGSLEWPLNLWRGVTFQASRQTEMLNNAEKYRVERCADYLVYGHTHTPGKVGDCFNCGTWARERDTFVQIDNAGVASVMEWTGTKAVPIEG